MSIVKPWVLYVAPEHANLGRAFALPSDPLLDALRDISNVVAVLVPIGRYGKMRSVIAEDAGGLSQLSSPEGTNRSTFRQMLYRLSNLANRLDSVSLPPLLKSSTAKPDLILVNDISASMRRVDDVDSKTAFWVNDPHVSVDRYFDIHHVNQYDTVFVAQKDYVETFRRRGCRNAQWLPMGCDQRYFVGPRFEKYDVAFVGKSYLNHPREAVLKMLRGAFPSVHVGSERQYDLGMVYRSARIVVNRSLNGELNLRTFEAMAAGGLLITDRIGNGLFDLFKEDIHLVCYDSLDELRDKVHFYLEHDDERRRIAENGRAEVLRNHTALARARRILEITLPGFRLAMPQNITETR